MPKSKPNKYTVSLVITTDERVTKEALRRALIAFLEAREILAPNTIDVLAEIDKVTVRSIDFD